MRNNKKEYPVNKLYIGYLGIYNLGYIKQEEIVIVRKKLKKYINIFNGRKYININEVEWKSECYGKMVICKLLPLEQGFKTNLAKTISEEELIVAYNVWNKKEKIKEKSPEQEIKNAVLMQILLVGEKVKKARINDLEKEAFKRKLIEIGEYYALELERIRKSDITLDHISELKLIKNCMEKLSEIEILIPERSQIGEIQKQLTLFKEKINNNL